MDALIGRKLDGRYLIEELIGAGGMANVYKANDILEQRAVAVKVLREEFVDNEELVRRFKNESKAISMLSHPNIVKVYDVNFSDAVQFIVMEYIDGINFMQYLESQGKLEWKEALHFTVQVLRALSHAHDRGIVHRDIKPQNIMVLRDGSIKVMDFGIARFSRSQTRTITDKAIGSVHYISPEQAMGGETDPKSDIYSLGVMLYEMLTGKLPFDSDSAVSVALKQISDTPQSPRELEPDIPEALEEITLKAMAKEPEGRYKSAAEMLKDIEEFKKNPDIKFEYAFMDTDNGGTKYFDAVEKGKVSNTGETPKISRSKAKKEKLKAPARRSWAIPAFVGITFACFVGALVLAYMVFTSGENSIFNKHEDVTLPDFTNMTIQEINEKSEYTHNFHFNIVEENSDKVEIGRVISQEPRPPITVLDNATITLYVSKGPEVVEVPDVIGFTYSEAFQALAGSKLGVRVETVSEGKPENQVIRTMPSAGEIVDANTIITVYVQKPYAGMATLYVPNLMGYTLSDADILLTANGMVLGEVTEVYTDEVERGIIMKQSIAPNRPAQMNMKIDVEVSAGPVPIEFNLSVVGYGNYSVAATVNGNEAPLVNGSCISAVPTGDAAVVIVTVTNPENGETVEFTREFSAAEVASGHLYVDASGEIPISWEKVELRLNITGFGSYSISVKVNGSAVSNLVGGEGSVVMGKGLAANVVVTITNGSKTATHTASTTAAATTFNIDVSSSIPAEWSEIVPDPGVEG